LSGGVPPRIVEAVMLDVLRVARCPEVWEWGHFSKLGQIPRGRADFDRALQCRRDHPDLTAEDSRELYAFQAEALLNGPAPISTVLLYRR
jgi:hypothetical protein